ncbi:MAG: HugZ family protein [Rhodobacteraceae bacterium]|nr:HugZ family protein [Paracoccaceae bacterium]
MSKDKKDVTLSPSDDARRLGKTLIRTARFASLATFDAETGSPLASRVLLANDMDGTPIILISSLAAHTSALETDPQCCLLVGEPGKGDPLAHPRVSVFCKAARVESDAPELERLRRRFLSRHPKAKLYVDFPDFAFYRLVPQRADLNGGFGKAYALERDDFILSEDQWQALAEWEDSAVTHMNDDHADAVALYAEELLGQGKASWKLATLDPEGIDLVAGDLIARYWFDAPIVRGDAFQSKLVELAKRARGSQ